MQFYIMTDDKIKEDIVSKIDSLIKIIHEDFE